MSIPTPHINAKAGDFAETPPADAEEEAPAKPKRKRATKKKA